MISFRVLVPLDGSPASETALSETERIAVGDAEVHLLHVVPSLPLNLGSLSAGVMEMQDQALSYLENLWWTRSSVRPRRLMRT